MQSQAGLFCPADKNITALSDEKEYRSIMGFLVSEVQITTSHSSPGEPHWLIQKLIAYPFGKLNLQGFPPYLTLKNVRIAAWSFKLFVLKCA